MLNNIILSEKIYRRDMVKNVLYHFDKFYSIGGELYPKNVC